ncbi:nuclear transport factor 2 family protein [Carboxylicivirga sp. M1479]|uniref:nuclear transport factor 2 family protein n=1 Tax=Carboxylicivirga sp. M1479 TaxID=2594476 RepID=UPI001177B993|nr:nuclear transport factor 2 family protein [Carboxylicivirga sp. M1479]TRX70273.1 nuclear transport factor 2 family protein [Carboxylicivirga sp. M1479]
MKTFSNFKANKDIKPIKDVLDTLVIAQESGDINAFSKCFYKGNNITNIGTDIDEIWHDWESFYSSIKPALSSNSNYTIATKDTHINLSKNKDVAWYYQLLDTSIETKGEQQRLEGFRHTGVLEKINNSWQIVQSHVSLPDNNFRQA